MQRVLQPFPQQDGARIVCVLSASSSSSSSTGLGSSHAAAFGALGEGFVIEVQGKASMAGACRESGFAGAHHSQGRNAMLYTSTAGMLTVLLAGVIRPPGRPASWQAGLHFAASSNTETPAVPIDRNSFLSKTLPHEDEWEKL